MPGQDISGGTYVPVGVDTAKALAELRLVQEQAAATRASVAGLPPPGPGTAASLSTRLTPMPRATVGGRSPAAMKKANQAHVTALRQMRRENGVLSGTIPVHVPSTGPSAAGAAAKSGPKSSMFLTPGASSEASMGAWAQHKKRLNKSFTDGFKLESEGARFGVFGVEKGGVSLASAWSRTLGPAMGYFAIAYAGLKVTEAGSEALFSAVEEAASTGRTVGQVIRDRFPDMARKLGGETYASIIGGLEAFGGPLRTTLLGAAAAIAVGSGQDSYARLAVQKARAASQDVADAVAWLRGEKSSKQRAAEFDSESEAAIVIAINESKRQAEKDTERVGQQLLGMGFPGTLENLKGAARPDVWVKYDDDLRELTKDVRAQRTALANGNTGGG